MKNNNEIDFSLTIVVVFNLKSDKIKISCAKMQMIHIIIIVISLF